MLCFTCWKFKGNGVTRWFVLSFLPKNFIHLCCHTCSFWSRTSGYLCEVYIQMDHRDQVRNRMQTHLPVLIPSVAIHMGIEVDMIHWIWSWTALLEQGFGQEDLQSSLPTSTIWIKVARLLYQKYVCSLTLTNIEDMGEVLYCILKILKEKHRYPCSSLPLSVSHWASWGLFLSFWNSGTFLNFNRKMFWIFQDLSCSFLPPVLSFYHIFTWYPFPVKEKECKTFLCSLPVSVQLRHDYIPRASQADRKLFSMGLCSKPVALIHTFLFLQSFLLCIFRSLQALFLLIDHLQCCTYSLHPGNIAPHT